MKLIAAGAMFGIVLLPNHTLGVTHSSLKASSRTPFRAEQARSSGAISGVVRDASSGEVIGSALVTLMPQNRRSSDATARQLTDRQGRFVFVDLPADPGYTLLVVKPGYFDGGYGRRAPKTSAVTPIALSQTAWFQNAHVSLWRPGSIHGTVTDEGGNPVVGVFVRALRRRPEGAQGRVLGGPYAVTDDRGAFRIEDLIPGQYSTMVPSAQSSIRSGSLTRVVGLSNGDIGHYPIPPLDDRGATPIYPITFSGNASEIAAAASFDVVSGGSVASEVQIRPVRGVTVRGSVSGPKEAVDRQFLRLLQVGIDELGIGSEVATTTTGTDGSFEFPAVPTGSYTLEAPLSINEYTTPGSTFDFSYGFRPGRSPGIRPGNIDASSGDALTPGFSRASIEGATYWARVPLDVGEGGLANVVVPLQRSGRVTGRLYVETDPTLPPPRTFPVVSLESATGEVWQGRVSLTRPSGGDRSSLLFQAVAPGEYLFRASGSDWILKSVVIAGRDWTQKPVDSTMAGLDDVAVTMTNAGAELSGIVRNSSGATTSATVIIFPVEPEQWANVGMSLRRVSTARASTAGVFQFRKLSAGKYYVVASSSDLEAWDAGFLERLAHVAARVSLGWGTRQTQDLALSIINR